MAELELSSVCLVRMVQNFIEESNEKRSVEKTGRNWCNCFDGNDDGSSGDKFDIWVHQRCNWVSSRWVENT